MLFIPTSELKERMLKTGAQAPFSVLSSAILNSYVDYRCKPVSRFSFPVPRSQILILVTTYKTCPVTRAFFQVFFIHGPHFKIYAFTCVWFWGCYMNKKFRSMPNVKRLWPPWTSSYLHNIIVTHVKHFSLSDICPVGKEDGKMSSLSQFPFLLCSAVAVHQLIVNTATAANVLRAKVSMHQTNSGKSPKFVFSLTFIFCSPICSNNNSYFSFREIIVFVRPLKYANFHREYYPSCVTSCIECNKPTVFLWT